MVYHLMKLNTFSISASTIQSENDQGIPQSQTAAKPMAPRGRAT